MSLDSLQIVKNSTSANNTSCRGEWKDWMWGALDQLTFDILQEREPPQRAAIYWIFLKVVRTGISVT